MAEKCWLVPELHPREHDPASLGILHEPLGLLPAIYNYRHPLGVRGLGPIWLGGHSGGGVHRIAFHPKGDKTRSEWMDCLTEKEPQLYARLQRRRVPEESELHESDTLQAGTQCMATNKSHGGPLGGM